MGRLGPGGKADARLCVDSNGGGGSAATATGTATATAGVAHERATHVVGVLAPPCVHSAAARGGGSSPVAVTGMSFPRAGRAAGCGAVRGAVAVRRRCVHGVLAACWRAQLPQGVHQEPAGRGTTHVCSIFRVRAHDARQARPLCISTSTLTCTFPHHAPSNTQTQTHDKRPCSLVVPAGDLPAPLSPQAPHQLGAQPPARRVRVGGQHEHGLGGVGQQPQQRLQPRVVARLLGSRPVGFAAELLARRRVRVGGV